MPWSGPYYYRCVRINGQPRRQYIGTGLIGQLANQLDDAARERKALGKAQADLALAEAEAVEADLTMVNGLVDVLARAALVAAGFHRHHRGPWRRKREDK